MNKKQFNAILAKNDIAREIKNYLKHDAPLSINFILNQLKVIEIFTGEANQPVIESILKSDLSI